MSEFTDNLMKQLHFVGRAGSMYMSQKKQRLTGQERVLEVLLSEDNLIQSYLAEILDLRPSSLAELMKKMEVNGDIIRTEDSEDKRIKRVTLTEAGRNKAEKNAGQKKDNYSEAFFAGLDDEEQKAFSEQLKQIADGWKDEFKEQSRHFVDPMDKLHIMKEMRDAFEKRHSDFHNMPREEQIEMRRKMEKMMKNENFTRGMRHRGFPAHMARCFGGDMNHDFFHDLWDDGDENNEK